MPVDLDQFLPYVIPYAPGCSEPLALQQLRLTCIDFCRRTDIVQRVEAPVDVVAGQQDYAVALPADMRLARVLGASWQGRWLTPMPPGALHSDVAVRGAPIGDASPIIGPPRYYFQRTPEAPTVSLYPIPDAGLVGGLFIKASFYPTMGAEGVDDQLFSDWAEGIGAGAVARLQVMPGQSFTSNPVPARAQYELTVSAAKRILLTGRMINGARVQPRRFV